MTSQIYSFADKNIKFKFSEEQLKDYIETAFPEFSIEPGIINIEVNLSLINSTQFIELTSKFKSNNLTASHPESGLEYFCDSGSLYIKLRDAGVSELNSGKYNIYINKNSNALRLVPDFLIQPTVLEILRMKNVFFFHSGTLSFKGLGVSFTGLSGAGKSTLIYSLVKSGWKFLSDDLTLFNLNGDKLFSFGKDIKVPIDSLKLLGENSGNILTGKKQIIISDNYLESINPGYLIFLEDRKNVPAISEVSGTGVLQKLLGSSIIPTFKDVNSENFQAINKLLDNYKGIYQLTLSNNLNEVKSLLEVTLG
ncbi:hypothetical protein KAU33_01920 [Candidatus Dependentiae bacterium]|nr:hypothetical protein [Candidatus Dependentiae bacterium]